MTMTFLGRRMVVFMENNGCDYENRNDILISSLDFPEITATAGLVDEDAPHNLCVSSISKDVEEFIALHHILKVEDIEKINCNMIWELFWKGKGDFYVNVGDFYVWYERIIPNKDTPGAFRVKTYEEGPFLVVTADLREPDHFLQHAIQYSKLA